MKKVLPVANAIALIVTIVINYLSNTGVFDGNTMATVSAKYPTLFTPAGYAFTIWIVIYLGLLGFIFYQFRKGPAPKRGPPQKSGPNTNPVPPVNPVPTNRVPSPESSTTVQQIGWWFVISCAANSCWVLAWLYGWTGLSVLIMLVLLMSLIKIILRTDMELTDPPLRLIAFVWWPFCFYSGWITVAFLANITVWLKATHWPPFENAQPAWAIAMVLLAGIVYLFMTWRRNMREYAFVGVWALVAVAIADSHPGHQSPAVSWTAYTVAATLFISSSIHGYRNRAFSPWRKRS